LEVAREQGCKTIAITHHAKSPITKVADLTLLNGSKEGPLQGGALSTKISQLLVLELIYTRILMNNEEKAIELKKKEREAIKDYIS
jgi:DNA-binding MurR/RpiR family transcriptional regulator